MYVYFARSISQFLVINPIFTHSESLVCRFRLDVLVRYKVFVAPTFVCIHFVVHYWESLVLLSALSCPAPPHQ